MQINLSKAEAKYLILKALGLADSAVLKVHSNGTTFLVTSHDVNINCGCADRVPSDNS